MRSSSPCYRDSSTTIGNGDSYSNMTSKRNKHTWFDRLLGIVCAKITQEKTRSTSWKCAQHGEVWHNRAQLCSVTNLYFQQYDGGFSPWLVPVYVLSTQRDKDKHLVPMEAKCTIDTGNMQGNIVSRKFVEEVLGYPKSAFCALTTEEKAGATGITGDHLVPEGAIYLTWYHKKSTRVFRDMRFLLSPIDHFDLIIGAGSIQKDRLLDVPNLIMDTIIPKDLTFLGRSTPII